MAALGQDDCAGAAPAPLERGRPSRARLYADAPDAQHDRVIRSEPEIHVSAARRPDLDGQSPAAYRALQQRPVHLLLPADNKGGRSRREPDGCRPHRHLRPGLEPVNRHAGARAGLAHRPEEGRRHLPSLDSGDHRGEGVSPPGLQADVDQPGSEGPEAAALLQVQRPVRPVHAERDWREQAVGDGHSLWRRRERDAQHKGPAAAIWQERQVSRALLTAGACCGCICGPCGSCGGSRGGRHCRCESDGDPAHGRRWRCCRGCSSCCSCEQRQGAGKADEHPGGALPQYRCPQRAPPRRHREPCGRELAGEGAGGAGGQEGAGSPGEGPGRLAPAGCRHADVDGPLWRDGQSAHEEQVAG
eukprot:m.171720 g.171720  ORF g.171720 m.171720 type:complete len:359 (-) comp17281_c0_seq5:678-1754(-)